MHTILHYRKLNCICIALLRNYSWTHYIAHCIPYTQQRFSSVCLKEKSKRNKGYNSWIEFGTMWAVYFLYLMLALTKHRGFGLKVHLLAKWNGNYLHQPATFAQKNETKSGTKQLTGRLAIFNNVYNKTDKRNYKSL